MRDSTRRFSDRVENYVRYRPGYPAEVVAAVAAEGRLSPHATIADIGAGTGLSARPFLDAGYRVIGVEPNAEMRAAGDRLLAGYTGFQSVSGTAEVTTLDDSSIDAIIAGQSFHWFQPAAARAEFARILKPGGVVALIWNNRRNDASPFLAEYEALLRRHCPEYEDISSTHGDPDAVARFFSPQPVKLATFSYRQEFDFEGLRGRLMSSSYAPAAGPPHDALIADLAALFERRAAGGRVAFEYSTLVFTGCVS